MLQNERPEDFVLATGTTTSIREFVEMAFGHIGSEIEWKGERGTVEEYGVDRKTGKTLIKIDPKYFRPTEVELLIGDNAKARRVLGWEPKTDVRTLAKIMVEADLKLLERKLA